MTHELALVGTFDAPSLSLQLARRFVEHELRDRCPDIRTRVFAPTSGAAGIDPVEALGPPDAGRVDAFRARFADVLVVGDATAAAAWLGPEQHVVHLRGEAGALASRWVTPDELRQRRAFLVAMGWWPATGRVAVVEGIPGAHAHVGADAMVVVEAEPSIAVAGNADRVVSMRAGAIADDVVAAIAHADVVVAEAPSVRAVASAFGRPLVPAQRAGEQRDEAARTLDAQLDALCRDLTGRHSQRFVAGEVAALQRALDARGRRLATERAAMADRAWAIERELEGRLAERDAHIAALESERDTLRARIEVRARSAIGRVVKRRKP